MSGRSRRSVVVSSRLDDLFAGLPKKLDVPQVAELLGMTTKGVYKWIHTGVVPAYKLGATWMILRDELRDTIASGSNLLAGNDADQGEDVDADE
jgi:excisionase family DNA binding protein